MTLRAYRHLSSDPNSFSTSIVGRSITIYHTRSKRFRWVIHEQILGCQHNGPVIPVNQWESTSKYLLSAEWLDYSLHVESGNIVVSHLICSGEWGCEDPSISHHEVKIVRLSILRYHTILQFWCKMQQWNEHRRCYWPCQTRLSRHCMWMVRQP